MSWTWLPNLRSSLFESLGTVRLHTHMLGLWKMRGCSRMYIREETQITIIPAQSVFFRQRARAFGAASAMHFSNCCKLFVGPKRIVVQCLKACQNCLYAALQAISMSIHIYICREIYVYIYAYMCIYIHKYTHVHICI